MCRMGVYSTLQFEYLTVCVKHNVEGIQTHICRYMIKHLQHPHHHFLYFQKWEHAAQAVPYLTYKTYCYILQIIFYISTWRWALAVPRPVEFHCIDASFITLFNPHSSTSTLRSYSAERAQDHLPLPCCWRVGMQGVGVKPSLALEALNTPDHSLLELLLASQIPHTHGLHPTSESLSVSFWTLLYLCYTSCLGPGSFLLSPLPQSHPGSWL